MSTAVAVYDPVLAMQQMLKQAYEAGRRAGKKEAQEELAEVVAVKKAKQLTDLELVTAYNSRRFRNQQRTGIKLAPVPPLGVQSNLTPQPPSPISADAGRGGRDSGGGRGASNSVSVEGAAKPEEKPAPPWGKQLQVATQQARQQDGGVPIIDLSDPAARAYANRVIQIKYGQGVRS